MNLMLMMLRSDLSFQSVLELFDENVFDDDEECQI